MSQLLIRGHKINERYCLVEQTPAPVHTSVLAFPYGALCLIQDTRASALTRIHANDIWREYRNGFINGLQAIHELNALDIDRDNALRLLAKPSLVHPEKEIVCLL